MANKKIPFTAADILIPKNPNTKWSVVACDQYTSQPDYWKEVEKTVGDSPSALNLILPEIFLNESREEKEKRIFNINKTMEKYLDEGVFDTYKDSMIFVRRTLPDGKIRYGIVGAIDLCEYDYTNSKKALIRATEQTVLDRIPPRVEIRKNAKIELPHVLMLINDEKHSVIEPLKNEDLKTVYDFDLMMGAGHVKGGLIEKPLQDRIIKALSELTDESCNDNLLFASGDGNHSLAAAKACYEQSKNPLQRYALVELVNIHDDSLEFEPIYRVLFNADYAKVVAEMDEFFKSDTVTCTEAQKLELMFNGEKHGYTIKSPKSVLTVGSVEKFIQHYLTNHKEAKVDYIHGTDTVENLCGNDNSVGFIFPGMRKDQLYETVIKDGVLPRKTFSMGEAASKRFYLEGRKIRD